MIRFQKLLQFLMLVCAIGAFTVGSAGAQDYAGPDKNICPGTSAQIGNSGEPGVCYAWSPETGLSDPHTANPVASPASTTTYTVTVVGANFSFTASDQVTVTVVDNITGISVTPVQCCWEEGETFSQDQFEINTIPGEMESQILAVMFTPAAAPGIPFAATQNVNVTVTVFTECGGNINEHTASVTVAVINEDFEVSSSNSVNLANIDRVKNLVQKVVNMFKFAPLCEPDASLSLSGTTKAGVMCCSQNEGCVREKLTVEGALSASASITCDFPLPPVPVLNIRVMGGAGISGSVSFETQCTEIESCFTLQGSASVGGGLSAGNENVLEASIMLVGEVTFPPVEYCLPEGKLDIPGEFCFALKVVGAVEFFSMYTQEISYTLLNDRCLVLW
jgi:hypothetical protein